MSKTIYHFSQHEAKISECILAKGKIYITSHGLGSGIYGVYNQKNLEKGNGSIYVFTIDNPYIIDTREKQRNYEKASTNLMEDLNENKEDSNIKYYFEDMIEKFLINFKDENFSYNDIHIALKRFWKDYNNSDKYYVHMPINYILEHKGYDGVYGDKIDSFQKGNVKFVKYPSYKKGDILPVNTTIARVSTDIKIINFTGYVQIKGKWVYLDESQIEQMKKEIEEEKTKEKERRKIKNEQKICKFCEKKGHIHIFCPEKKPLK